MTGGLWPTGVTPAADQVVCPHLGLADDPRTHFAFATTDHRCHSGSALKVVAVTHQVSFCLSANYPGCRRYVVPAAPAVKPAVLPVRAAAPIARVKGSAAHKSGPMGRRRSVVRAAVILAGVLTLAIVAAWFLGQGSSPGGPSGISGSSPSATLAGPTVSPQPPPPNSLPPTNAPTISPTASAPSLPTTHVVARYETLYSIARQYGVTVAAIQEANDLTDPNYIVVGQSLIIPAP